MTGDGDLERTLLCATAALERLGVPFHVTGGLASSYYGEPRLTQDIDLVVGLEAQSVVELVALLDRDFIVDAAFVETAVQERRMFQALHRETLIRVDFHVGERIEGELDRCVSQPLFGGHEVPLVSKADAILSKLIWIRDGSEKSRRDVIGMLLDPTPYDRQSVEARAVEHGCAGILSELEGEAGEG